MTGELHTETTRRTRLQAQEAAPPYFFVRASQLTEHELVGHVFVDSDGFDLLGLRPPTVGIGRHPGFARYAMAMMGDQAWVAAPNRDDLPVLFSNRPPVLWPHLFSANPDGEDVRAYHLPRAMAFDGPFKRNADVNLGFVDGMSVIHVIRMFMFGYAPPEPHIQRKVDALYQAQEDEWEDALGNAWGTPLQLNAHALFLDLRRHYTCGFQLAEITPLVNKHLSSSISRDFRYFAQKLTECWTNVDRAIQRLETSEPVASKTDTGSMFMHVLDPQKLGPVTVFSRDGTAGVIQSTPLSELTDTQQESKGVMAKEIEVKNVTATTAEGEGKALAQDLTERLRVAGSVFVTELVSIAKESGERAGVRAGVKLVHDPILAALERKTSEQAVILFFRNFLASDVGLAFTGIILSFILMALPWKTAKTQAIVHELRVEAGSRLWGPPLEFILGPVREGLANLLMFAGDLEAAQGVKNLTPETFVSAVTSGVGLSVSDTPDASPPEPATVPPTSAPGANASDPPKSASGKGKRDV